MLRGLKKNIDTKNYLKRTSLDGAENEVNATMSAGRANGFHHKFKPAN